MRRQVIVYSPRPATTRWIHEELADEQYKIVVVPTFEALIARLAERVDQIAVVDFDGVQNEEVSSMLAIRDTAWTGELIVIGRIELKLRMLLRAREMIMRPLGSERLRVALQKLVFNASSIPISGMEPTSEITGFH